MKHGGDPHWSGVAADVDWLELSTGIAPQSYPLTMPDAGAWQNLLQRVRSVDSACGQGALAKVAVPC